MTRVAKALAFATAAHEGQVRKFTGLPYITHPIACAALSEVFKISTHQEDLYIAMLLHDTVEDSDATLETVTKMFGPIVGELVGALTSDPMEIQRVGKTAYLKEKMTHMRSWQLVGKLLDRLHNCSDLRYADGAWKQKYIAETRGILTHVRLNRETLSPTHVRLMGEIDNLLDRC